MKTTRTGLTLALALIALSANIASAAATVARVTAPVTGIALDRAITDAQLLAARHPAAAVMQVAGDSMLPFFGDGSVLVVRPLSADRLREGMIVVYTNRDAETVAHRVMGRTAEGWIVRGYNNDTADSTVVTAENLQGVVYATFHSSGRASSPALLAEVSRGVRLALAAPAK